MTTNKDSVDYKCHAEKLANAVETFIWLHSGDSDGCLLPEICQQGIEALESYNKAVGSKFVTLKALMQLAEEQARAEGSDVYAAMLKAIATRSKDCYEHMDDDREIYLDIKEWLEYEASLEVKQ
jgi:hypothetical protein